MWSWTHTRGQGFVMRAEVDADHESDIVTSRSRTGFIICLSCAPILWSSQKQTSDESGSLGSELISLRQCCEHLREWRHEHLDDGSPL